jgi:hypothetical protein
VAHASIEHVRCNLFFSLSIVIPTAQMNELMPQNILLWLCKGSWLPSRTTGTRCPVSCHWNISTVFHDDSMGGMILFGGALVIVNVTPYLRLRRIYGALSQLFQGRTDIPQEPQKLSGFSDFTTPVPVGSFA